MIAWFIQRWSLEVTFEEARAHRGIDRQPQRNGEAIWRTTPLRLGQFSIVALLARQVIEQEKLSIRQATGYRKSFPREEASGTPVSRTSRQPGVRAVPR